MGRRLKALRQDDAYKPAPNAYALPSGIGSANPDLKKSPAYFLTFRNQKGKSLLVYTGKSLLVYTGKSLLVYIQVSHC